MQPLHNVLLRKKDGARLRLAAKVDTSNPRTHAQNCSQKSASGFSRELEQVSDRMIKVCDSRGKYKSVCRHTVWCYLSLYPLLLPLLPPISLSPFICSKLTVQNLVFPTFNNCETYMLLLFNSLFRTERT